MNEFKTIAGDSGRPTRAEDKVKIFPRHVWTSRSPAPGIVTLVIVIVIVVIVIMTIMVIVTIMTVIVLVFMIIFHSAVVGPDVPVQ